MRQFIQRSLPVLRGGPDFGDSSLYEVDCGTATIEFLATRSPIDGPGSKVPPTQVNLDSPPLELMEKASESRTGHSRIVLNAANWMYGGPWWRCGQEPYVVVTQTWKIERVKGDLSLDTENIEELKEYLAQDYEAYFESEGGPNAEVRREAYEIFEKRNGPIELHERGITAFIKSRTLTLPSDFKLKRVAEMDWVRFTWEPKFKGQPKAIFYCTMVNAKNILTVGFSFVRMTPDSETYWLKTALKDIDRVMTGTRVKYRSLSAKP